MNHIHVGFKQELTPDFKLPAELAAGAPVPAPAVAGVVAPGVAGAAPVAPVAAAGDPKRASGLFAVPEPAKLASAEAGKAGADSGLFLRAVAAEQPRAVAAAPAVPADAGAPAAVDLSAVDAGYPGDDAPKDQIAAWMAKQAQAARAAAATARDGRTGRIGAAEPQPRRRRLGRLLPDAPVDLEPGRDVRLRRRPRQATGLVPRHRRTRQRTTRRTQPVDHRPRPVRRMDRRRRTPRRAIPRPLPTPTRRSQPAAQQHTPNTHPSSPRCPLLRSMAAAAASMPQPRRCCRMRTSSCRRAPARTCRRVSSTRVWSRSWRSWPRTTRSD